MRMMPEDLLIALIDRDWYLAKNPDVDTAKIDAVDHFLSTGWRERRDPNPWFHVAWYLGKHPDVLARNVNPLEHFVAEGAAAGCQPSPGFDIVWYSRHYLDAERPSAEALLHFMTVGLAMGAVPYPRLMSSKAPGSAHWSAPDGTNAPKATAADSANDDLLQSLVDSAWYRALYKPAEGPLFRPAEHYLNEGWRYGHDPNPWFDTSWYLSQNPDIRDLNKSPLEHFVIAGARAGRRPHAFFDLEWYADHYLGGVELSADLLRHFLAVGLIAGAVPNPRIATAAVRRRLLATPVTERSGLIERLFALLSQVMAYGEADPAVDPDLLSLLLAEDFPDGVLAVLLICGSGPGSAERARAAARVLPMQEYGIFGVVEDAHVLRIVNALEDGGVSVRFRLPDQHETLKTLLMKLNCHRAAVVDDGYIRTSPADLVRSIEIPVFENGPERHRARGPNWRSYPNPPAEPARPE